MILSTTRLSLVTATLALSAILAGCGGGGGSDPAASTTTTVSLGARGMPGTALSVTAETPIAAGQPVSVLIEAADLPAGASLAAKVGTSYETASSATITPLAANRWRATMTLPDPLVAKTCVLVALTLADGSVLESGLQDFVLAP